MHSGARTTAVLGTEKQTTMIIPLKKFAHQVNRRQADADELPANLVRKPNGGKVKPGNASNPAGRKCVAYQVLVDRRKSQNMEKRYTGRDKPLSLARPHYWSRQSAKIQLEGDTASTACLVSVDEERQR